MQRLQTILATDHAIPILKKLPHDLHPYIYRFIHDEVKVHYLMCKYDYEETLQHLREYYCEFNLIR